jgi:glyceraldehyde 3-phosphate dehydrogenase
MSPVRVGINGFGRIGRCVVRAAIKHHADVEFVAVNDIVEPATLAHLLAYDSVYGPLDDVSVDGQDIIVGALAKPIRALAERDPAALPWAELKADVVIESTGRFASREDAAAHLDAGARKVIISAPGKDADATVVLGVNFDAVYDREVHHVISNASCTTNCLAPVAKVLHDTVGIRAGLMTTIHAYTGDQNLIDGPHKDLRRARAAAINLVPSSTGAAKALGLVIPELNGKLNGFAVRVPTPTGSLVDLTVEVQRATSAQEINDAFAVAADAGALEGILAYTQAPIVSSDIVGSPYSSIFDSALTTVIEGTVVKVLAWYDNEWGYSNRLVDLTARV